MFDDFSLKVDLLDYPLIALNRQAGLNYEVGVVYNIARRGGTTGAWYFDAAEDYSFFGAGRGIALAIGQNDSLLMGYADSGDIGDSLMISIQDVYKVFVPIVRR